MMRSKLAPAVGVTALQVCRAIRNPDALPVEIPLRLSIVARSLLRLRTCKKRAMEHTQFQSSCRVRNGDRKKARILIINIAQFDAVPMRIRRESKPLPVETAIAILGPTGENAAYLMM